MTRTRFGIILGLPGLVASIQPIARAAEPAAAKSAEEVSFPIKAFLSN